MAIKIILPNNISSSKVHNALAKLGISYDLPTIDTNDFTITKLHSFIESFLHTQVVAKLMPSYNVSFYSSGAGQYSLTLSKTIKHTRSEFTGDSVTTLKYGKDSKHIATDMDDNIAFSKYNSGKVQSNTFLEKNYDANTIDNQETLRVKSTLDSVVHEQVLKQDITKKNLEEQKWVEEIGRFIVDQADGEHNAKGAAFGSIFAGITNAAGSALAALGSFGIAGVTAGVGTKKDSTVNKDKKIDDYKSTDVGKYEGGIPLWKNYKGISTLLNTASSSQLTYQSHLGTEQNNNIIQNKTINNSQFSVNLATNAITKNLTVDGNIDITANVDRHDSYQYANVIEDTTNVTDISKNSYHTIIGNQLRFLNSSYYHHLFIGIQNRSDKGLGTVFDFLGGEKVDVGESYHGGSALDNMSKFKLSLEFYSGFYFHVNVGINAQLYLATQVERWDNMQKTNFEGFSIKKSMQQTANTENNIESAALKVSNNKITKIEQNYLDAVNSYKGDKKENLLKKNPARATKDTSGMSHMGSALSNAFVEIAEEIAEEAIEGGFGLLVDDHINWGGESKQAEHIMKHMPTTDEIDTMDKNTDEYKELKEDALAAIQADDNIVNDENYQGIFQALDVS